MLRHIAVLFVAATPAPILAQDPTEAPSSYEYAIPDEIDDGWRVGGLHEAGLDPQSLRRLVSDIREQRLVNIHSVLIARDGRLVFEEYFEGRDEQRGLPLGMVRFDRTVLHDLRSVTKTVTGALMGIAVGQDLIRVDARLAEVLQEQVELSLGPKADLTLGDLLTMRSGLAWDETTYDYTDPRNSETAMDMSPSSVQFVLSQRLLSEPGAQFQYCGGCTMLLSAAIREASGLDLDVFAKEALFEPLGIEEYAWLHHQDGLPIAASGLRLRPRDLLKIGYLYVSRGRWLGTEVLAEEWIEESTRAHVRFDSDSGYGYQWWTEHRLLDGAEAPIWVARGNGGQRIYVVPSLDLVAVITAGNYNGPGSRYSEQAFWSYILPATGVSVSTRRD